MRNFQDSFETRKRSFVSVFFSICITIPLIGNKTAENVGILCKAKSIMN